MISMTTIVVATAKCAGVTAEQLSGPGRSRRLVVPRQRAIMITRRLRPLSMPEIGRRLGGRHHTTVLNGLRAAEGRLVDDPREPAEVAKVLAELGLSELPPASLGTMKRSLRSIDIEIFAAEQRLARLQATRAKTLLDLETT